MRRLHGFVLMGLLFALVVAAQAQLTTYQKVFVGSTGSVTITGDGFTGYPSWQDAMGYVNSSNNLQFVAWNWINDHDVDTGSVQITGPTPGYDPRHYSQDGGRRRGRAADL
jgi:hypothetical protein